jgi:hypothetical protein
MRTPPVGVLLLVFIGKHRFKGATMQVECHHIGGGERLLREMGEKEFVDNALVGVTDAALCLASWMGTTTRQRTPSGPTPTSGQS